MSHIGNTLQRHVNNRPPFQTPPTAKKGIATIRRLSHPSKHSKILRTPVPLSFRLVTSQRPHPQTEVSGATHSYHFPSFYPLSMPWVARHTSPAAAHKTRHHLPLHPHLHTHKTHNRQQSIRIQVAKSHSQVPPPQELLLGPNVGSPSARS